MKIPLHYIIFLIALSSPLLQSMWSRPLSLIEKQLMHREIRKHGITSIYKKAANQNLIPLNYNPGKKFNVALTIEDIFYKKDILTDPLTKKIFNKIKKIEKTSEYIPEKIIKHHYSFPTGYTVIPATNYLGRNTRYYWLEENGKRTAVRVKADLYKEDLFKIIDTYKE